MSSIQTGLVIDLIMGLSNNQILPVTGLIPPENKPAPSTTKPSQYTKHKSSQHSLVKLCLLLICLFCLSGCDLNYPAKFQAELTLDYAFVAKGSLYAETPASLESIQDLRFNTFDTDKIIDFKQQKQDLLLKITVLNAPDNISEYTLSLYPKYLKQVSYFNQSEVFGFSEPINLYRNLTDENRYYSSQRFAYNIDHKSINNKHFLLIKSDSNRYAKVDIVDTQSYIKSDSQFSHFFTMVYSIILAMVLFNAVFYIYTRDTSYLLYTLYMITALYSLLWQEGKVNDVPWLAWHILGTQSSVGFFIVLDAVAILFFYHFMRLSFSKSWLVKLVVMCVLFRIGLLVTSLVQFYLLDNLQYDLISTLFNLSAIVSTFLVWIIMLIKTIQGFPQAKYLFIAWSLLIFTVALRLYFAFNPHPDLIWMPHSYELGIMLEGLILAFAMANRTMEFRKQRDQAVSKYTAAERSIQEHQLITQFQHEMQDLVKDPTLSADEVTEKINIKFHLLINKALPIKNSMIHVGEQLNGICTTGLQPIDIDLMNFKLNKIFSSNTRNQTSQFEISTSKNKVMTFLYLPLNSNDFKQTRFILGLKNNKPINPNLMSKFMTYCESAYAALNQAIELHQVAMAANLDGMTGIHNHSSIEQIINESLKNASRTTLAYVDLDDLKAINDQFGHSTGDQCIIDFVTLLTTTLQDNAKLGRIGGDEFIAVFSDIEFEYCEDLLDGFMNTLKDSQFTDENLNITASVGLAESRINETTQSLLKKADVALYHSKAQGKNLLTIYTTDLQNQTD